MKKTIFYQVTVIKPHWDAKVFQALTKWQAKNISQKYKKDGWEVRTEKIK